MKKNSGKTKLSSKAGWVVLFSLLFMVFLAAGFYAYHVQGRKGSVYARVNSWLQDRNTRLHKNLIKVKKLADKHKVVPQQEIHFEFYTTLPNMRVPIPPADKPASPVAALPKIMTTNLPKAGPIFDENRLQNAMNEEFYTVSHGVSSRKTRRSW